MADYEYQGNWAVDLLLRERRRRYCIRCEHERTLLYIDDYRVWLFNTPAYTCDGCITLEELAR